MAAYRGTELVTAEPDSEWSPPLGVAATN